MRKKGRVVRGGRLSTLVKVSAIVLVSACFIVSAVIIYSDVETVEEVWARKERAWKLEEEKWDMETNALRNTLEKLELVLDSRSIDPRKITHLPYSENERHAIVTSIVGDRDHPEFLSALALIKSLREVETRVANIIVLYYGGGKEMPLLIERALRRLDANIVSIEPARTPPSAQWTQIWARFQAWSLTDYDRVLYMDPRSIAVDNLDHLLDLQDPADHKSGPEAIIHTALRQPSCQFWEPCNPRTYPSHRMFTVKPSEAMHEYVTSRIMSKGEELMVEDALSLISDEISYTPFPSPKYDIPFGECTCRGFRNMKSYTMDCLQVHDIWSDVLGRLFVERECTHDLMVTWMRLFVSSIERLDR